MRDEKRRRREEKGMNTNGLLQEELKGKKVIQVACGAHHTAALTARGRLWLWGDNSKYQAFVVEASEISPFPKLVEVSPPYLSTLLSPALPPSSSSFFSLQIP